MVSPGHARGASILLHRFKNSPSLSSAAAFEEAQLWRERRFAFSALGDPHTSCMTCGPGPRVRGWIALVRVRRDFLRRLGARAGESSLKRDSLACNSYAFAFSPLVAPFRLRALHAPLHSRSPAPHLRRRRHHDFAWPTRPLPDQGDARCGVPPAWMERAGARREDPRWRHSPR
jgi:hypothetical protein